MPPIDEEDYPFFCDSCFENKYLDKDEEELFKLTLEYV